MVRVRTSSDRLMKSFMSKSLRGQKYHPPSQNFKKYSIFTIHLIIFYVNLRNINDKLYYMDILASVNTDTNS